MTQAADQYVEQLTRRSQTSFYYPFLFLPREKRKAIFAVYAFCRAADDMADGPGEVADKFMALDGWREELDRCYQGHPAHPITTALLPAVRKYSLPRDYFEGILDGVTMDLTRTRYQTFEELAEYCHRVASLVGLLCLEVFGYRNPGSRDYARELGMAFQITNILRDLGPDADTGRIYLPQEDLSRFSVSEEDLLLRKDSPQLRDLVRFEALRARDRFARAEALLPREDRKNMVVAQIMSRVYQTILKKIERIGYDVLHHHISLGRVLKVRIALSTYLSERVKRGG